MEGFEQFVGVNFWTMIFAWCNLIVLYLVLRKILFKPIMNMIESRQKEIDELYAILRRAEQEAKRGEPVAGNEEKEE